MNQSASPSAAFELLDRRIQKWIWDEGWETLHDIQEQAIPAILSGDTDVLIGAATAGGKTEAAFLPAVSASARDDDSDRGLSILYLSPLKALINDQFRRLESMLSVVDLPAYRWHGDVSASHKKKLMGQPSGALLITPESLEAIFVRRGVEAPGLFAGLRYVVVDELHAFMGSERGRQLQSLLARVERASGRRIPRIALSATLGDMRLAADALRPGEADGVRCIISESEGQELHLQIRGYTQRNPKIDPSKATPDTDFEDTVEGDDLDIAEHLQLTLGGGRHIVFANRREDVERYSDILRRFCERDKRPNEYWPHHGSLSRALREDAESALRDGNQPATVIATTTLELGIDVGSVQSIGQIGPPPSVSAVRQRLGRSGRRGDPAVMRIYIREKRITSQSPVLDELRTGLIQSIATVRLLVQRWYEPPPRAALHLSTLVQQVLSLIAERGGIRAKESYKLLCGDGPFRRVGPDQFATLLHDLGSHDLLVQMHTGELVLGLTGERLVNHYDFYAAFWSPEEFRLVADGRTLGSLPILYPIAPGFYLIFGGRRWKVVSVDESAKVIDLVASAGGRPPSFSGSSALVHAHVRAEMVAVYEDAAAPLFLNPGALELLAEGRDAWRRLALSRTSVVPNGGECLLFPWTGDREMNTILLQLHGRGLSVSQEGVALRVEGIQRDDLLSELKTLEAQGLVNAQDLAMTAENLQTQKHHRFLSRELLAADYGSARLDPEGAHRALVYVLGKELRDPRALRSSQDNVAEGEC